MESCLQQIQRFLILSALFLSPIITSKNFDYPFETPKIILFYAVSILLFLVLFLRLLAEKVSFKFSKLIFLFFLINLISFINSPDKNLSLFGKYGYFTDSLIFIFYCLVLYISMLTLNINKKFILSLVLVCAGSLTITSLMGFKDILINIKEQGYFLYRISSTFGQPNKLAFFLLPVNIMLIFSLNIFKNKVIKLLLLCSITLGSIALFLTFSKSSFLVLLIFFLIILFKNFKNKLLITAFLLAFLALSYFAQKNLYETINSILTPNPYSSTYLRFIEQKTALEIWGKQKLIAKLIGTGPEIIVYNYNLYKPKIINQNDNEWLWETSKIRSLYLHYLNTIGIVGLLIYLALILKLILSAENFKNNYLLTGAYFAFIVLFLENFFYYQTIPQAIYFWVFAGILELNIKPHLIEKPCLNPPAGGKPGLYPAVKSFLYFFIIVFTIIQINFLGRFYIADKNSHLNAPNTLDRAVQLFPYFSIYFQKLGKNYFNNALVYWETKNLLLFQDLIQKSVYYHTQALNLNPNNISNLRSLQWTLYNAGSKLDKKYQIENLGVSLKIVKLSPFDPLAWDSLGLCYLNLRNFSDAITSFQKALELKPNLIGSYLHLGETYKQMGQPKKALGFYVQALKLAPNNNLVKEELIKLKI